MASSHPGGHKYKTGNDMVYKKGGGWKKIVSNNKIGVLKILEIKFNLTVIIQKLLIQKLN